MPEKKLEEINENEIKDENELEDVNAGWDVPLPTIHPCPYCGELLNYAFIEKRNVKDGCSNVTQYKCFNCGQWF